MKKNKMWGGRFEASVSDIMMQINASIGVDKRLWLEDITGSRAHCKMLIKQQIISQEDGEAILGGLDKIELEISEGQFVFEEALEDIHMNIEARLKELIGEAAGRLHTARSRNDQVATDFRLWVRWACEAVIAEIQDFQGVLKQICDAHALAVMPGFTHLQVAQPVTLGMHLSAYWHMLERDKTRFEDCMKRLNECPLGACALSGTGFNIDRAYTAELLGFTKPMANTMDAVSARDFAVEFLYCCAQSGLHLSRLAEEIILWATPQFGFLSLSDAWSTGSSIMPQKKNPDAAELVRGKSGRLSGNLNQLMMVMKGLPLAYNKDMQEDKYSAFDSFDTLCLCLKAMSEMLRTGEFKLERMQNAALDGYATATEIADWLVSVLNMPFRDAHHVTGRIVKLAEQQGVRLDELALSDMQAIEPQITPDIYNALNAQKAVEKRLKTKV